MIYHQKCRSSSPNSDENCLSILQNIKDVIIYFSSAVVLSKHINSARNFEAGNQILQQLQKYMVFM